MVIRDVPGREYHPRKRAWSFPRRFLESVVEEFQDMGFTVSVNGAIQHGSGANPFPALRASMDPVTWRRDSRVLADQLDPQVGGDARLFGLLRRTIRAEQEQRKQRAS